MVSDFSAKITWPAGLVIAVLCAAGAPFEARASGFEVEATISNTNGKRLTDLPVFLPVHAIFGRGLDYSQFNPRWFHIFDDTGRQIDYMHRPLPPNFSIANDELVFFVPVLEQDARLRYRFTATYEDSSHYRPFDINALLNNPNNWVPNPGFEQGLEHWRGAGRIVTDVKHSGDKSLLLEVLGKGKVTAKLDKPFTFEKQGHYYFSCWARSQNVARSGHRWPQAGGRIVVHGRPFAGPIAKVQDTRNWYCYKPTSRGKDRYPDHWNVPAATFRPGGPFMDKKKKRRRPIWDNQGRSALSLSLNQLDLYYVDRLIPGRMWVDDILLFDQPKIVFDYSAALKQAGLDRLFVYGRAVTHDAAWSASSRPLPWEKLERIEAVAARGERKVLMLGVNAPQPVDRLELDVSDLQGPQVLGQAQREIEYQFIPWTGFTYNRREHWVISGERPHSTDRPSHNEYFIAYRIPRNAKAGVYRGVVYVRADDLEPIAVPLSLTVVDYPLKVITDRYIGAIYNDGVGNQDGGSRPRRDAAFYRYYSRSNFTYMMMFSKFLPFKGRKVDLPALRKKMRQMRDVAGCSAGVGLYWDCSLDRFGHGGLWAKLNKNEQAYRQQVIEMNNTLANAGLPKLVYMVWDEPRSVNRRFGILKGTGAITTCDAMGNQFGQCLNYFTHTSYDDPAQEMGPAIYRYCKSKGVKFGVCGTAWQNKSARYQVGMMIAAADMHYWHQWHLANFYVWYKPTREFARTRVAVSMGEGMIDLRYHDTLRQAIDWARRQQVAEQEVAAAEKYLRDVFAYCSGDSDGHLHPYNGTPSDWGDDRFYDHWRAQMRRHTLNILSKTGPLPGS